MKAYQHDTSGITVTLTGEQAAIVFSNDGTIELYIPSQEDHEVAHGSSKAVTACVVMLRTPFLREQVTTYLNGLAGKTTND